jgi:hypothetical protein
LRAWGCHPPGATRCVWRPYTPSCAVAVPLDDSRSATGTFDHLFKMYPILLTSHKTHQQLSGGFSAAKRTSWPWSTRKRRSTGRRNSSACGSPMTSTKRSPQQPAPRAPPSRGGPAACWCGRLQARRVRRRGGDHDIGHCRQTDDDRAVAQGSWSARNHVHRPGVDVESRGGFAAGGRCATIFACRRTRPPRSGNTVRHFFSHSLACMAARGRLSPNSTPPEAGGSSSTVNHTCLQTVAYLTNGNQMAFRSPVIEATCLCQASMEAISLVASLPSSSQVDRVR